MSVNEKMTELADAVRELTGVTEKLSLDAMIQNIRGAISSAVISSAMGSVVNLSDSLARKFYGLTLYGKTTQNCTPTPTNPVELESVGADGNIAVNVFGKNLLKPSGNASSIADGITFTKNTDGSVSVKGTASTTTYYSYRSNFPAGTYIVSGAPSGGKFAELDVFVNSKDAETGAVIKNSIARDAVDTTMQQFTIEQYCLLEYIMRVGSGKTVDAIFYPMIRPASIDDATYEPYKAQTLTVSTPNGLPGIPVTSGGNYTDDKGQQWICDEIDFARGKYVQRVLSMKIADRTMVLDAEKESSTRFKLDIGVEYRGGMGFGSHLQRTDWGDTPNTIGFGPITSRNRTTAYMEISGKYTVNTAKELIRNNNWVAMVALETPIETDLTAEELFAYSNLRTYHPNTTIFNDDGAWMAVQYAADKATTADYIAALQELGVDV